jgi:NADH-quinone oxidoreductase subunit J
MLHGLDHILGQACFALLALAALGCGTGVLLARHPLNGAVSLVGAMLALAGIYALLGAPFLGVLQVLTYAGAIMMLVVFVIMVLNRARDHEVPRFDRHAALLAAVPVLLLAGLLPVLLRGGYPADPAAPRGEPQALAALLFDLAPGGPGWFLLFELVGALLLVAVAGAVLLAKRDLEAPERPEGGGEDGHGAH